MMIMMVMIMMKKTMPIRILIIIIRHCSLEGCRNSCDNHGECVADHDGEYSCQCRFVIIIIITVTMMMMTMRVKLMENTFVNAGS